MYLSEPVLAAASSYYTSESEKNRDAVISEVKAQLNSKMLLPPCGDTGEMMSAALLGFTMDKIRMKEGRREEPYMAEPVKLSELLHKLQGKAKNMPEDLDG